MTKPKRIRLGCIYCERDDYDEISENELPDDWADIGEVQTYEEATREVDINDLTRSVLDWETHLGVCPECQKVQDYNI